MSKIVEIAPDKFAVRCAHGGSYYTRFREDAVAFLESGLADLDPYDFSMENRVKLKKAHDALSDSCRSL